jgi:hypothetical protein
MNLTCAFTAMALISVLATTGLGDEVDLQDLSLEYPSKDAVYLSTASIVVAVRSQSAFAVELKDESEFGRRCVGGRC